MVLEVFRREPESNRTGGPRSGEAQARDGENYAARIVKDGSRSQG